MTKLMTEAIHALCNLPDARQDELAPFLLALATGDKVGDLDWVKPYIAEAEADIEAGRTVPLEKHLAHVRDVLGKLNAG